MDLMRCEEAHDLLSAFIDGELAGERKRAIAAHVTSCPTCGSLANDYRRIGKQLLSRYEHAPVDLDEKIRSNLAREKPSGRSIQARNWRALMRQAAVLLIAVASSALVTWHLERTSAQFALLERDVLGAHARSLLQENPTQIASSDRHTVKPWFTGRVDFAPTVKDLSANGFPLAGGRLDLVGDRRVAAVVYKRRQHIINVFMWPADATEMSKPRLVAPKGYNAITWNANGITFWAVSDLNAGELAELQKLL
jgi:anti-sigma factor RsiW